VDQGGRGEGLDRAGVLADEGRHVLEHPAVDERQRVRLADRPQQRGDARALVRVEQLGRVDAGQRRRALGAMECLELLGQLVDGGPAVVVVEVGPGPAEHDPRPPTHDQPVVAQLPAVGDDRRVADLGRQVGAERRLAVETLVGSAVDAHGMVVGQPNLVGHAAGALERDGRIQARALEGAPCARHRQARHRELPRRSITSLSAQDRPS
jgi:hypothetical protein